MSNFPQINMRATASFPVRRATAWPAYAWTGTTSSPSTPPSPSPQARPAVIRACDDRGDDVQKRSPFDIGRLVALPRRRRGPRGDGRVDPLVRLDRFLKGAGWMDDNAAASIEDEERVAVLRAMEGAEARPKPRLDTMFTDVYHEKPPHLVRQEGELRRHLKSHDIPYQ
jgi:hypothetical protein